MTGIAAIALVAAVAYLAGRARAVRRRRRDPMMQRPLVLASPGGRAFASNVDTLSDFRMGLELPRARK